MARPSVMPWPWFGHRTLAEVDLTERLIVESRTRILSAREQIRLGRLLYKAARHNPPADDQAGAA